MKPRVVVLTGAGISAESGIPTFRDGGGWWQRYRFEELASPEAWARQPEVVLAFYNHRRETAARAVPNAAHEALVRLEQTYDVTIVTQNVDDLHERAGSAQVIHVHGQLNCARSSVDPALIYHIGARDLSLGERCERGSQLRPHIVWFGEQVLQLPEALTAVRAASRLLVIGTSLQVYPAAGLALEAHAASERVLITREVDAVPEGFEFRPGNASELVPELVDAWLADQSPTSP